MEENSTRRKIFKLALIVGGIMLVIIGLTFFGGRGQTPKQEEEKIDTFAEDAPVDYHTSANIIGSEALVGSLNSPAAQDFSPIEALGTDLHTFGRAAYSAYNDDSKPIGFKVTSDVKKEGNIVTFDGRFGSSKNKVTIRLELLNNARMKTSITDTVTRFNTDATLPSNSKVNQFIGSLPISGDDYNITYTSNNTINIGLYFRDPKIRDRANQAIVDILGEEDTKKLKISISYPSADFGL